MNRIIFFFICLLMITLFVKMNFNVYPMPIYHSSICLLQEGSYHQIYCRKESQCRQKFPNNRLDITSPCQSDCLYQVHFHWCSLPKRILRKGILSITYVNMTDVSSIHLFIHPSIHQSIYPSIHADIHTSTRKHLHKFHFHGQTCNQLNLTWFFIRHPFSAMSFWNHSVFKDIRFKLTWFVALPTQRYCQVHQKHIFRGKIKDFVTEKYI